MLIFALDFWQVTLFLSVLIICVAYNYITAAPELSGLMFLYAFVCLLVCLLVVRISEKFVWILMKFGIGKLWSRGKIVIF